MDDGRVSVGSWSISPVGQQSGVQGEFQTEV